MSSDPERPGSEPDAPLPAAPADPELNVPEGSVSETTAPARATTKQDAPAAPAAWPDDADGRPGHEPGELVVAMSPRQIIGGFVLLAGLILMLRRRRKG